MVNVSKRKLKGKDKEKLRHQFVDLLSNVNHRSAQTLVTELFSESEQTMFLKRLAIIILVDKNLSKYRIAQMLLVSESTVREIAHKHQVGQYDKLLLLTRSKKFDTEAFWETMEILLRAGMPPMGKDRWKNTLKRLR